MANKEHECPKCRARIEWAFIVGYSHMNQMRVSNWVEGVPEKGWWLGLSVKDKRSLPVTTYRCVSCGYLES
jgi:hypothetical protein